MSLPLRRFKHVQQARRAAPITFGEKTEMSSKVGLSDQDVFGHMTNTRYNALASIALDCHLMRTGLTNTLTASGKRLVLIKEDVVFHRSLKFPDRFVITTQILKADAKHLVAEHVFQRGSSRMADLRTALRAVDRQGAASDLPLTSPPLSQIG